MADEFMDGRDAYHPVRWESADGTEVKYLSLEAAVQRIARTYDEPDAEAITVGLMAGQRYRTMFAFYEYEDPS